MIKDLDEQTPENPDLRSLRFMASDYFATGEGRTVSILITTMSPAFGDKSEWLTEPKWVLADNEAGIGHYAPGQLKGTPRDVLKRQFVDVFGVWLSYGIEFHEWETMKENYAAYLPDFVVERIEARDCHLVFNTQLHLNFS